MHRNTLLASLLGVSLALVAPALGQQAPPPAKAPPSPSTTAAEPNPSEVLGQMAKTLAEVQRFSVNIRATYDVVQEDGQKITFEERRSVVIARPDRMRLESQTSDGKHKLIVFDGSAVTIFDARENVYGRVDKPGTVDQAVRHLLVEQNMRVPLALMLVSTLPNDLQTRVKSIDYVERNPLTPVPTHHLAGQGDDVDFEAWIAAEGQPLPYRFAITYKRERGAPQYRAEFSDWNLAPDISPAVTAFTPPEGAQRIPILVRTPRQPSETAAKPAAKSKGTTR